MLCACSVDGNRGEIEYTISKCSSKGGWKLNQIFSIIIRTKQAIPSAYILFFCLHTALGRLFLNVQFGVILVSSCLSKVSHWGNPGSCQCCLELTTDNYVHKSNGSFSVTTLQVTSENQVPQFNSHISDYQTCCKVSQTCSQDMPSVMLLKLWRVMKSYEDTKVSIAPFCPSGFSVIEQLSSVSSSNTEIFLLSMGKLMASGGHHLQRGQQAATKNRAGSIATTGIYPSAKITL